METGQRVRIIKESTGPEAEYSLYGKTGTIVLYAGVQGDEGCTNGYVVEMDDDGRNLMFFDGELEAIEE